MSKKPRIGRIVLPGNKPRHPPRPKDDPEIEYVVTALTQLARRSHLHPAPIVPASEEGEWAPCRTRLSKRECACACIDSLGYHRAKHTLDGDGKCIFDCDGRVR